MARKRKQVAVYLSEDTSKELCELVHKGKRSQFVEKAIIDFTNNLKQHYGKNWFKGYLKEKELFEY